MNDPVTLWWFGLCAVSLANGAAWLASARVLARPGTPAAVQRFQRWQWLLCGGYVLGCGFRSWFPVFDVPRLCLQDSWLSTALVGRSVATLAELCFAAQWALLLQALGRRQHQPAVVWAGQVLLPLIAIAELCSWTSVLTTSNLGHVLEESLWAASAVLVVLSMLQLRPGVPARLRPLLTLFVTAGVAYVGYMLLVDVPMYWQRWQAGLAAGHQSLTLLQGLAHASQACTVSFQFAHWRSEMLWMALYFSVAVWFSIAVVHLPLGGNVDDANTQPLRRAPDNDLPDPRLDHAGLSAGVLVQAHAEDAGTLNPSS